MFASQRWLPGEVPAATSTSSALQRQPVMAARSDRPRTAENNPGATVAKPRSTNNVDTAERLSGKIPLVAEPISTERTPRVAPGKHNIAPARSRNRIGAPSIRFPKPDFRNSTPEPSPQSPIRTYTSLSAPPRPRPNSGIRKYSPSHAAPKFFRTPDGTQIVKFSDGSTRFVRPNQGNLQSVSYR